MVHPWKASAPGGAAESIREADLGRLRELTAELELLDKDMIPHHESAIAMAEVARDNTDDPEIREIANDIVSAQEREIELMERWRQQWYPEG
jgi:uncharacterized protein (DUF305 family)